MKTFRKGIITSALAIDKASKLVGSDRRLARQIDVSSQSILYWKFNTLLPYDKAVAIHIITNGKVSLDELRPDLKLLNKKITIVTSDDVAIANKY